jgi:transposase
MESGLDAILSWINRRPIRSRRCFPVRLNLDERQKLQRLLESDHPKWVRQRAAILLHADENVSVKCNKEIAAITDTVMSTVTKTCRQFVELGLEQTFARRQSPKQSFRHLPTSEKTQPRYSGKSVASISLTPQERTALQKIVTENNSAKGRIKRAQILLTIEDFAGKKSFQKIAEMLNVNVYTVSHTYRRFIQNGVKHAVDHKHMTFSPSGGGSLLNDDQKASLIKMFQEQPPKDYKKWTMKLLAEQVVARGIGPAISHETVRKVLIKQGLWPQR